ncbi:MAG: hypothetical protein RBT65_07445 [Methanolobus sp.]|nr:hypothetical protein [Methanolobus sp.]
MNRDKEAIIHTLLELYQLLVNIEEEYNTSDSMLKKQKVLDDLKNVREEIKQLEEELEKNNFFDKRVHHFNINDTPRTVIMTDIDKILDYIYEIKDLKLQRIELDKYLKAIFKE